jgi:hypothetical protein
MGMKVNTLDIELDDDTRVILTITRAGSLSIQTLRECSHGERPFWRLTGSTVVVPADLREWATTLCGVSTPRGHGHRNHQRNNQ